MKFELAEITTKDRLIHQGIFLRPERAGKKALLWIHGLTGKFYGDPTLMNLFAEECAKNNMAFAAFNNRGHDIISSMRKEREYVTIGAGNEIFEESIFDIDAAISYLGHQGFDQIILAGNSTGANKTCYYAGSTQDQRVVGVVLAGPISDRLSVRLNATIPMGFTAVRVQSLMSPNSTEDVFNYGDETHVLTTFQNITAPTLVVLAGNDEFVDRPIETIRKAFDTHTGSKQYRSVIIPDATHGYEGKQQELVRTVVDWAAGL